MPKKKIPAEIPIRQLTRAFTVDVTPRRSWGQLKVPEVKRKMRMVKLEVRVEVLFQWRDAKGLWHNIPHVRDAESFEKAHKESGYKMVKVGS